MEQTSQAINSNEHPPRGNSAATSNAPLVPKKPASRLEAKTGSAEAMATKPAQVIRDGAIAASIWLRQSPTGFAYYDFTLSRSWKSLKTNKMGYSDSYFAENTSAMIKVLEKTHEWIKANSTQQVAAE